ncbi:MAG: DNA cytosine methyltransferase [Pirellulaceae bacterium]|nr:DNA cytosine methyltransferase [Pirellulaceae bacterium]
MFTEFFCGIGGFASVMPPQTEALSIDINRNALEIHALNFAHRRSCKSLESLPVATATQFPDKFWWMSPPCQPYTRRGKQRDLEDPRAAGFRNMLTLISHVRPHCIGMENVPEFQSSQSHALLLETLSRAHYHLAEVILCPTQLGSVNRRRRYYLIASQDSLLPWRTLVESPLLAQYSRRLESAVDMSQFGLSAAWQTQFASALHVIQAEAFLEGREQTTCFTSAYGRSPVYSGSWLETPQGIRQFTPREILRQLGFPDSFQIPAWPPEKLGPLIGNTLSLPAITYLLRHFPADSCPSPVQPTWQR